MRESEQPDDAGLAKRLEEDQVIPLALQYFQAVDAIIVGEIPDSMGYTPVYLYSAVEDQPRIVILRHTSNYVDGNTGIQDEIYIPTQDKRLQLNGERNPQGVYVKYPEPLQNSSIPYIEDLTRGFKELSNQDGAFIIIGNQKRFIAEKGVWVPLVESSNTSAHLPFDNQPQLPPGNP